MLGSQIYKGLTALALGIALGTIGIDELTGQARLAFGYAQLLDGIDLVVVAVGLFAVGEALHVASPKICATSLLKKCKVHCG